MPVWLTAVLAASQIVLSGTFPPEVPSRPTIESWDRMSGQAEHKGSRIAYELFVDPKRTLLYSITRFRIHIAGREQPEDEFLIWNARAGARPPEYLRCFTRVSRRRLGLLHTWAWESVPPATPPYQQAMFTATEVYMLQRAREEEAAK